MIGRSWLSRRPKPSPAQRLAGAPAGRRVLLLGKADSDGVRSWQRFLADGSSPDTVTVLDPADKLPRRIRGVPVQDLAVVLAPPAEVPQGLERLFGDVTVAVRHGGRFLLDRAYADDRAQPLDHWLADQVAERAEDGPPATSRHVGYVIGEIEATPDLLCVRVARTHLALLRNHEVTWQLPRREPGATVEVLDSRPAQTFASRSQVHTHGFGEFPEVFECPTLQLREYRAPKGIAVSRRGLAFVGHSILPETYRWHLAKTPMSHHVKGGQRAGWKRVLPVDRPKEHLPGTYYHLDSPFDTHFGHVTTEVVSRLWGWAEAKRRHPDLKVLLLHWRHEYDWYTPGRTPPKLPGRFFEAYGIAPEDIVWTDRPVTVDGLIGATPMWHQTEPFYVHPELEETWERLAHGFTGGDPDSGPVHERVFVSRGAGARFRPCRNQPEVERLFADHGFEIIYPEDHPLPEQVRIFRKARVVAGFGGSGMFNMMYARHLQRLIVLNHEEYWAKNEHMFSSVLGNEQHYFWSGADLGPDDAEKEEVFRSGWEFDFDRNRDELGALLADS